jgi:hypothetical protein
MKLAHIHSFMSRRKEKSKNNSHKLIIFIDVSETDERLEDEKDEWFF